MLNMLQQADSAVPRNGYESDPAVLSRRATTAGLLGLAWLSVCVGILTLFSAFVLFGAKAIHSRDMAGFTYYGSMIYLPEREIPLYVVGCAFTVGLQALLSVLWKRRLRSHSQPAQFARESGLFYGKVATAGLLIGTLAIFVVRHFFIHEKIGSGFGAILLMVVPAAQLVAFLRFPSASNSRQNHQNPNEQDPKDIANLFEHETPNLTTPATVHTDIDADLRPGFHSDIATSDVATLFASPVDADDPVRDGQDSVSPLPASDDADISQHTGRKRTRESSASETPAVKANVLRWLDYAVPFLLFLIIFVPRPDLLIGHIFVNEHFHHWDFFMVGPAVGYARGLALGTQTYSQYGIGWPVVLAKLAPILPLGYTSALWIGQIYCLAYYIGLYAFFRVLLSSNRPRPVLAAFGTLLALYWRHYAWLGNNFPVWELPQNSMLRTPFDVWFLFALLLHLRTERSGWLMAAAAFTGLSLLFETDNGIYLVFVFGLYNLYSLLRTFRNQQTRTRLSQHIGISLAAGLVVAVVTLAGMAVASRGTLWQGAFWKGWLESFIAYPSGVSMLPVSAYRQGILYGMFQIGIYLFAVCYRRDRYFEERTEPSERLQLWIGLYGLCLAIHYIGRSHPNYLFESSLPLAILVVCAVTRLVLWADRRREQGYYLWPTLVYRAVAAFVIIIIGLQLQNMRTYPSAVHAIVRQVLKGKRPETAELFAHAAGGRLPWSEKAQADTYNALAQEIGKLSRQGKQVAIISNDDTSLYLASGARPWSRYLPLLPNLITKRQLEETGAALAAGTADYVYIPEHDPCEMYTTWYPLVTTDAWLTLRRITRQHYTLDHVTGPYQVYRR